MEPFSLDSQNWRQMIYLGAVLIMLISGLLMRKDTNFGAIIKYSIMWLAAVAACVLLYSYRYDFFDLKNRLLGEINPSAANVVNPAHVVIDADEEGKFYVDTVIDDKTIRFLVDPELNAIVLNQKDAKRIMKEGDSLVLNSYYFDRGKNVGAATFKINEIKVADVQINEIDALVSEDGEVVSTLGKPFFERFSKYDISARTISFDGLLDAPGQIIVRSSSDNHFYMKVLMDGVLVRCMIDTGASKISLDMNHLKMLNINPATLSFNYTMQTANGSSRAASYNLNELSIGGIKFSKVDVLIGEGDMGGVCLLGMDFLRRFKRYESFQDRLVLTM